MKLIRARDHILYLNTTTNNNNNNLYSAFHETECHFTITDNHKMNNTTSWERPAGKGASSAGI